MTRDHITGIIRRAQPCTAQQIKAIAKADNLPPVWDDELLRMLDELVSDKACIRSTGLAAKGAGNNGRVPATVYRLPAKTAEPCC